MSAWIKIACPCNREHCRTALDGVSVYIEEECGKLLGFVAEDSAIATKVAFFCTECKRIVLAEVVHGLESTEIEVTTYQKGQQLKTIIGTVVSYVG